MADITLIVIIVGCILGVVAIVLFGVLFVYCRRRLKKGTNIRRRVVQGEEIVKVRPPDPEPIRPPPEIIQDVVYRPPTPPLPPLPRVEHFERRGSWPKREPNPEYVIVRKKHHHGRHKRRRPSLEADRHIYRTEIIEDSCSCSSSDDESSSGKSAGRVRPIPVPVYPVPVPTTYAASAPPPTAIANMKWQPYMVNGQQQQQQQPQQQTAQVAVANTGQSNEFDSTFFWRPTQRSNEYAVGGGEVAFNNDI